MLIGTRMGRDGRAVIRMVIATEITQTVPAQEWVINGRTMTSSATTMERRLVISLATSQQIRHLAISLTTVSRRINPTSHQPEISRNLLPVTDPARILRLTALRKTTMIHGTVATRRTVLLRSHHPGRIARTNNRCVKPNQKTESE